jgi:hypothetical protein
MSLGSWADAALHQYYEEVQELHTLVGRASPLMDRLRKTAVEGAVTGEFFTLSGGMGIAGDLASAQEVANQVGTNGAGTAPGAGTHDGEWLVPTGQIETSLRIKYKDLVAGKSNKGAYLRNLTHATDKHGEYFGERFAQIILGSGGYRLGLFDLTNTGTGVITCLDANGNVDASNIANIYKGMVLVASANDGTSLSHTLLPSNVAAQRGYVLSVDRDAGTFVVSDTAGSTTPEIPAGWGSAGDNVSLFPLGQFKPTLPGSTLTTKLLCQTLSDWITPTAATDTFGTVDRSVDSALSGVRVPSTGTMAGLSPEHKIGFASTYMQSRYAGRRPLTFVAQSEVWFSIVRSLHAQGIIKDIGSMLTGGARSVQVMGVNGMCEILAEPHQDPTFIYGLDLPEIMIRHLDGLPGVANADGLEMLRQADSNDLEFRLLAFPQLICREPWLHCRFAV